MSIYNSLNECLTTYVKNMHEDIDKCTNIMDLMHTDMQDIDEAIIKDRENIQKTEYCRSFSQVDDEQSGFDFPCDENGELIDNLSDAAKENFLNCIEHPEEYIDNGIQKRSWTYTAPAKMKCDHCGEVFNLEDQYEGACECPNCGQWYNLFGQKLQDPSYWDNDEYDESLDNTEDLNYEDDLDNDFYDYFKN